MKRISLLLLLTITSVQLFSQSLDELLQKAEKSSTEIAIDLYDSASQIALEVGDSATYLEALQNWSELRVNNREMEVVIQRLEKTDLERFTNHPKQLYQVLKIFNKAHGLLNHHDHVLEISERLLELNYDLYDELNADRVDFQYYIGMMQANLFFFQKGLRNLKKALSLSIQFHGELHERTAVLYNNIGLVYKSMNDYSNAIIFYEKTLELLNQFDPDNYRARATITNNIAGVYHRQGYIEKALAINKEAIDYLQKAERPNPSMYFKRAVIYVDLDSSELSLKNMKKGLGILHQMYPKDHPRVWAALAQTGLAFTRTEQYDSAQFYLDKVLEFSKGFEDSHEGIYTAYLGLGNLAKAQSDDMKAIEFYNKAISYYSNEYQPDDPIETPAIEFLSYNYSGVSIYEVISLKAELLHEMGIKNDDKRLLEQSLSHYELGIRLHNQHLVSSFNKEQAFDLAEQRQGSYKGALEACYSLYEKHGDKIYAEKAFDLIENSKASVLYQNLVSSSLESGNDPDSLIAQLEQAKNEFNASILIYQKLKSSQPDSAVAFRTQLISQQEKIENLNWRIKKNFKNFYSLDLYDSTQLKAKELMASSSTLLHFFEIDESNYYGLAVSDNGILLHKISLMESIDEDLTSLSSSNLSEKSFTFYLSLIKPFNKVIKNSKKLIILPDGKLSNIPFEILTSSNNSGKSINEWDYLIKDYQISYHYSTKLLLLNKSKKLNSPTSLIAYAPTFKQVSQSLLATRSAKDSSLIEELVNLPEAQKEARGIANIFSGNLRIGQTATETDFKKNSPHYEVIHLATHAISENNQPMLSKMIFSNEGDTLNDGILHAYEMHELDLNANLVSLSACNTGIGKYYKGEGVMSLAWSFMYAGVPNVMMSLWSVPDKSTSEIMQSFYKYLNEGLGKSAALRQAKLDYLAKADNNSAHPYFWAGFVFIGNPEIEDSYITENWIPFAGLSITLLAFGMFYHRKRLFS